MEPITLVALALAAASAGANYQAQQKVDTESARAMRKNLLRNEEEEELARGAARRTRGEYENIGDKIESEGEDYKDNLIELGDEIGANFTSPTSSDGILSDSVIASREKNEQGMKRYREKLAGQLGNLRGFDQAMATSNRGARNNAFDIRQAQSNMRGNNRLLELDLNSAQGAGKTWGTVGDIASIGSMIAGIAALTAPAAGAGAAGEATASQVANASTVAPTALDVGGVKEMALEQAIMRAAPTAITPAISGATVASNAGIAPWLSNVFKPRPRVNPGWGNLPTKI